MIALLALLACNGATPAEFAVCDLQLVPDRTAAFPADVVTLTGGPFSVDFDTVVTVGGVRADEIEILREGCDICDACRDEAACLSCGACIECDAICEADCVETTLVTIPDAPPGPTAIAVVNTFGTGAVDFRVLGGDMTAATGGTGNTGSTASTADTATTGSTADTASTATTATTADTSAAQGTGDTGP